MEPRIETIPAKKLVGKRAAMSLSNNTTAQLWKSFMQNRKEVTNSVGSDLYSLQVYPISYFDDFNPNKEFQKWAVIEVTSFDTIPTEMEAFHLDGGLYAVFVHKGAASSGAKTFQYIFGVWLPNSDYLLDTGPHFEVLGEKYKNDDPDSEEEIWIPVKPKFITLAD